MITKTYEPKTIAPPTKEEKELAKETHQKIMALITTVRSAESELEHDYVSLGKHIYTMQAKTLWIALGYDGWKEYMEYLSDKFGKGRTQLYGYVGTVKSLTPYADDETLVDMGISKAKELKRAVDTTNQAPSEELLKKGRDPKVMVPEFRKAVQEEFHIIDHNEQGVWRDFKGCYLTVDESKVIDKAFSLAKSIDPVIPHDLPSHSQFKEVLLRLSEEFISTYDHPEENLWADNENTSGKMPDVDTFNDIFNEANTENFASYES